MLLHNFLFFKTLIVFFLIQISNCKQSFESNIEIVNSNGILFQKKSRISFTDSEWVIATDISFRQAEDIFNLLEKNLEEKSKVDLTKTDNSSLIAMIQHEIVNHAKHQLSQLQLTKNRFRSLTDAILNDSSERRKRDAGLFNFGGKMLNFLFGVATTDEVDIIHTQLGKLS